MLLHEICEILQAELINDIRSLDKEINMVCGSDLLSDVLAFTKSGTLLLTGLINPQVVRTAEMVDILAICFVRGKRPQAETVKLAKDKHVPLLTTRFSMFECCGRLYKQGLRGCDDFK